MKSIKLLTLFVFLSSLFFSCEKEEITKIFITEAPLTINVGDTKALHISYEPQHLSAPACTWKSSDTNIVTVTEDGIVSAKSVGTATITANTQNGLWAGCTVTVAPVEVTEIKLNYSEYDIIWGKDTLLLTAQVFPENATYKEVKWEDGFKNFVDLPCIAFKPIEGENACQVFADLKHTYSNGQRTWVGAKIGDVSARCYINIEYIGAESFQIGEDVSDETGTHFVEIKDIEIEQFSKNKQFAINYLPYYAIDRNFYENYLNFNFSSSDDKVATMELDDSGNIYLVNRGVGECTISVTYRENMTAELHVKVLPLDLSDISVQIGEEVSDETGTHFVELKDIEIEIGSNAKQIVANISTSKDLDKEIFKQNLILSSSDDKVATIRKDESGNTYIVNKGVGECTIFATYNEKIMAELHVKVYAPEVTDISFKKNKIDMVLGETIDLLTNNCQVEPKNAGTDNLIWTSSNTSVVTVDASGLVKTTGIGYATVTVETKDGKCFDTMEISVEDISKYVSLNVETQGSIIQVGGIIVAAEKTLRVKVVNWSNVRINIKDVYILNEYDYSKITDIKKDFSGNSYSYGRTIKISNGYCTTDPYLNYYYWVVIYEFNGKEYTLTEKAW